MTFPQTFHLFFSLFGKQKYWLISFNENFSGIFAEISRKGKQNLTYYLT